MRFIVMFCAAALAVPTPSAAQPVSDWPIAAGSRVRILSPVLGKRYVTGSVIAATLDTLVFRAARESTSTAIPTPHIVKLDIARGTHTNTARFGFGGFLLGALVGAAIGAATTAPPCYNCLDFSQGYYALTGGVIGGAIGGLVGATIGKRPSDTWVPVTLPAR
jgi:hypothetical protein